MHTYLLIDLANLFNRAKHVVPKKSDIEEKTGLVLHTILSSMSKCWKLFSPDHVVFMLEGRSWRKDVYPPYKMNRAAKTASLTQREIEEEKLFRDALQQLIDFISEKTNCTVLQNSILEADDLIAGWIKHHPTDKHVIISTDGDFVQLISENVSIYNGVTQVYTRIDGVYDDKMRQLKDKKTLLPLVPPNPEWALFEKCMRGDNSDNVFSAYPGVREKGSKNKTGLREAFADKEAKGFHWNNLMLQKFMHHDGTEHRVLEDYQRNVMLCDLSAQPDNVKKIIEETIRAVSQKNKSQIGIYFMKFCGKHGLISISDFAAQYVEMFSSKYENHESVSN